jgi:hypothetical protein
MAAFTVHIPNVAAGETVSPEKIVFLRDEFSWGAFFFGPLWLAWRRAWLAALLWTLGLVLLTIAGQRLGLGRGFASTIGCALAVVLGFEGSRVVAWALARKGYSESDLVIGDDIDEAEMVFFHRWRHEGATSFAPQSGAAGSGNDRRGEAPSL